MPEYKGKESVGLFLLTIISPVVYSALLLFSWKWLVKEDESWKGKSGRRAYPTDQFALRKGAGC